MARPKTGQDDRERSTTKCADGVQRMFSGPQPTQAGRTQDPEVSSLTHGSAAAHDTLQSRGSGTDCSGSLMGKEKKMFPEAHKNLNKEKEKEKKKQIVPGRLRRSPKHLAVEHCSWKKKEEKNNNRNSGLPARVLSVCS